MAEPSTDVPVEIAHILFIDIVGYSKLLMNEQSEVLQRLNDVVRRTEQFRIAEAGEKLIRIPVGDGMALVFFDTPEAPVRAAVEISEGLRDHPQIRLRMGIHSGPVNKVLDVNQRANVAGAGINTAQRVMDCGDAGHILLSKRVADDLAPFEHWRSQLHELGEVEAKHGETVFLVNFYNDKVGNRQLPQKLKKTRQEAIGSGPGEPPATLAKARRVPLWPIVIGGLALLLGGLFLLSREGPKTILNSASPNDGIAESVPEKSIAVLPFENLSKDEENAFFAGGVQDEILSDLAKIADLKVISRTSVMRYKTGPERNLREIAKVLGVAHVVEGSVQRAGNRVRVSAQLIDARSDAHLWAEHYDRDLADIFAIQTEIAQKIADQLRAKLSPQEKVTLANQATQDTAAYDFYLKGKEIIQNTTTNDFHSGTTYSKAADLLEKAVARDPNFALAQCLLAQANLALYWLDESVVGARERAEVALQEARRLAPDAGETHLTEALSFYWGKRDYEHALQALQKAASSLPNSVDVFRYKSWVERRLGRWSECISDQVKAIELDPRNWHPRDELSGTYVLTRDYTAAARVADEAIRVFPDKADDFRIQRIEVAFSAGDLKAARASLADVSFPDPPSWHFFYVPFLERNYGEAMRVLDVWDRRHDDENARFPRSFLRAIANRAAGQSEEARAQFVLARKYFATLLAERKAQPFLLSQLALVDAALDHGEEAVQEARHAVELLPISRDATEGPDIVRNLALVYAQLGNKDLAIEQLTAIAKIPSSMSYGELNLDPQWDALRGDPRFEQIVTSLKPK